MATISEALEIALGHHQGGRLREAEQIYRQILEVDPNQADALHLLGVIALQIGKHDVATLHISRAIELNGTEAVFHSNLGNTFEAQGKLNEAAACFRRALELKPASSEAIGNLAHAFLDLGNAFRAQGKLDEAIACFRGALELKPDYFEAHNNLGNAFKAEGKLEEAIGCFRRALVLNPQYAEAHNNLGNTFQAQGKLDEAVACYLLALELQPDHAVVHYNLGTTYQAWGKLHDAVACYRRALELKPSLAEAHHNLGAVLSEQGKSDEALAFYRRAIELKAGFTEAGRNLLFTLQYRTGTTLRELAAAHAEYDLEQAAALRSTWRPHEIDRDAARPLRVGFDSADFGQHPVGYFLIGALENLDRGQCETICYSDRLSKDELTTRFQGAATIWREVSGLRDPELAELVRADRIDILFDLAGHSAGNRLLVFARKPAPIQVTWAGYVGTTGLAAMDYILADRYEIPPDAEAHYSERVLRMPDGYVCYEPPPYAPAVSRLPALQQGLIVFGSFNNRAKITSQVIEVWARILGRVPQSRLVLKHRGMNDGSVAHDLANEFASRGVDPRRIECLGWSPHGALLAEYGRIDLALDPFPYNGGLTTCEALWMGVPVITCPGETFASRHSLSHLSNVGLTETIARDLDEYVELAVSFANDLPRLAALRAGMRERMAALPMCDGKRFADNLMRILRDVWREWCLEAARPERQPVVSDDAAVPAAAAGGLGGGVCGDVC